MRSLSSILTVAAMLCVTGNLHGQEAPMQAVEDELRTMVTADSARTDRDRQAVRAFLDRADVADLATAQGLDMEWIKSGVGTLDADAAEDLARQVRTAEEEPDQVGGDTIVISSSAIIIALLVLILLQA